MRTGWLLLVVAVACSSSSGTSTGSFDGGVGAGDAGLSPDESEWLDPMNAARAAVGEAPLHWDPIAAAVARRR